MSLAVCPCGSGQSYLHCCGQYHSGAAFPATAEALMRSRYTAYTQANISYIQATMTGPAAENFDAQDAEQWASSVKWKRLKIVATDAHPTDPDTAYVKFRAFYIAQGKLCELIELSEFKRIAGKWYYYRNAS